MKREELERIAKELKDKYLEQDIIEFNKYAQMIEKEVLSVDRLLGKNNYTDEEILDLSKKAKAPQESIDTLISEYDINNMSNHSSILENGIDVLDICKDMRGLDYEILRYLMFDNNDKYIGYIEVKGKNMHVDADAIDELNNNLFSNYPNCKEIICIHNHPHCVCAIINKQDIKQLDTLSSLLNEHNMKLKDGCVISELDYYSRNHDNNKKSEAI